MSRRENRQTSKIHIIVVRLFRFRVVLGLLVLTRKERNRTKHPKASHKKGGICMAASIISNIAKGLINRVSEPDSGYNKRKRALESRVSKVKQLFTGSKSSVTATPSLNEDVLAMQGLPDIGLLGANIRQHPDWNPNYEEVVTYDTDGN